MGGGVISLRISECVLEDGLVEPGWSSAAVSRHICPYPAQRDCSNDTDTNLRPLLASSADATSSGDCEDGIGFSDAFQSLERMTKAESKTIRRSKALSERRSRGSMQREDFVLNEGFWLTLSQYTVFDE